MRIWAKRRWLFLLCAFVISVPPAASGQEAYPSNPLAARFIYKDVTRFWEAFDRLSAPRGPANPFEAYIALGSPGLRAFVPNRRIVGPQQMLDLVQQERTYYEIVRPSTLRAGVYEAQIRAAYAAMKYWYPPAVFPPVYYVIGRTTSGGTASAAGMVIGIETFSAEPARTSYGRPAADLDNLPFIVAHELVHFLQTEPSGAATLLHQALREGSADFVGELIAGSHVKGLNGPDVYPYGEANEATLWGEFRARMHETDVEGWLYGGAPDGRPDNLGYWMGYQIVQAYFNSARDKHQAIREILSMTDPRAFLVTSGYPTGGAGMSPASGRPASLAR